MSFTFRPNTSDEIVYRYVHEKNEYQIPERLNPEDRIIDVGAQIGSFSYLCWLRGARRIEAYEAQCDNYKIACDNLASTEVAIYHQAVWRSDLPQDVQLHITDFSLMEVDGPDPITPGTVNTGSSTVFGESGENVETIALDQIIGEEPVSILKLDCEGSEYPILLTSRKLRNVHFITGEYHVFRDIPAVAAVPGHEVYTVETLALYLASLGFDFESRPFPHPQFSERIGNFYARNLSYEAVKQRG